MDGERILNTIVLAFTGFGCGGLFYWMGVWASKRKDPMHFYSGTTVDPSTISDIPAYNRANAKMWKRFSVPFWVCGVCSVLNLWLPEIAGIVAMVSIGLACTVGIFGLVWSYKKICRQYKIS